VRIADRRRCLLCNTTSARTNRTAYVAAHAFDVLQVRNGIARAPGVTEALLVSISIHSGPGDTRIDHLVTLDARDQRHDGRRRCAGFAAARAARPLHSYFARPLLVNRERWKNDPCPLPTPARTPSCALGLSRTVRLSALRRHDLEGRQLGPNVTITQGDVTFAHTKDLYGKS
jgi:hypothetical protein